jgi:hypothetical protein
MGDVDIGHQQGIIPDPGKSTALFGAAVNGDKFADNTAISNFSPGHFTLEFQGLGDGADRGKLEYLTLGPNLDVGIDNGMGTDDGSISNGHLITNDGIGTDGDILSDFSSWADYCAWVYHHYTSKVAIN